MAKKRKAIRVAVSLEDIASDADGEGLDGQAPGSQLTKQPSVGGGANGKPVRRRRAGQPPAPVELPEVSDMEPATNRKRHKRREGENGRMEAEEGPSSPRGQDHPDSFDRNISSLAETVVKVFCVHSEPNYSLPWQRKRQFSSTGSGFIISGRRILTNAHCVDHHSQVKLRRRGSDTKYVATVLAVGTECDIACLTVKDDAFWEGTESVTFGTLPHLQDSILVIGYPIGGDSQSVTSGVVSRIEVTSYVHGSSELLGMQIDAAINSGNSGGPAFNGKGECVGIAFQSLKNEDAENIGYVIPPPVIHHFLDDFERNGRYTGFPALGLEWQKMESPFLQKAMHMKAGQKGVLVRRIEPTLPANKQLRKGDILLSFDGTQIGNDGTVAFRSGERIGFSYLISNKQNDEDAEIEILRGGKVSKVRVQLKGPHRLIPSHIRGANPSYFIFAGLVFTAVTVPYLRSEYGKEFEFDAPVKILDKLLHAMAEDKSEQVVVVGQVLASEVNFGFEDIVNTAILQVNGVPVKNLKEVVAAVEACHAPFLRMDLDYNQVVILDTAAARKSTPDILKVHGIPSDRSPDLILLKEASPPKRSRSAGKVDNAT